MESWLKVVLVLSVLITASSFSPLIYRILNEYEEECYRYKIYEWNEVYCKSSIGYIDWKNTNIEHPCCAEESHNFTWGHNGSKGTSRWCTGFPFNKTLWEFTDECDVYHLIRKP